METRLRVVINSEMGLEMARRCSSRHSLIAYFVMTIFLHHEDELNGGWSFKCLAC